MPDPAAVAKPRRTARQREIRRLRIIGRAQQGATYEEIAKDEGLTRERIRQIVVNTLKRRAIEPSPDHTRLQIARLGPALRLAAERVAQRDLRAVEPLMRVLDRLDKYQRMAAALRLDQDDRIDDEKFDMVLADLLARIKRDDGARAERAPAPAGEPPADDSVSKFFRP